MRILLLCLKGFETMEFSPFIDVMGWAGNDYGIDVNVETCGLKKTVMSTFNIAVTVDVLMENVDVSDYDALAIPGGFEEFGFYSEAYDERTLALIREFNRQHKWISSVCVGALPIAKSGILAGRYATTYHLRDGYRRKQLEELGVNLGNEWLVVDDNVITSSCPKTAVEVAFQLLELLTTKEEMLKVKEAMGYM